MPVIYNKYMFFDFWASILIYREKTLKTIYVTEYMFDFKIVSQDSSLHE